MENTTNNNPQSPQRSPVPQRAPAPNRAPSPPAHGMNAVPTNRATASSRGGAKAAIALASFIAVAAGWWGLAHPFGSAPMDTAQNINVDFADPSANANPAPQLQALPTIAPLATVAPLNAGNAPQPQAQSQPQTQPQAQPVAPTAQPQFQAPAAPQPSTGFFGRVRPLARSRSSR